MIRVLALLALGLCFAATAWAAPSPQPAPSAHHHKITWVAYTYREGGVGSDGSHWWRSCHVSRRGRRICGVWHPVQP